MKTRHLVGAFTFVASVVVHSMGSQLPLVGTWNVSGSTFRALCVADREAREVMHLPGAASDAEYKVDDVGETLIVTITQSNVPEGPRCVEIRIRKSDYSVIFRVTRDANMSYEEFRAREGRRLGRTEGGSQEQPKGRAEGDTPRPLTK